MQMLAQEYPITQMSEVLEVACSTYYHRRAQVDEQELRQAIVAVAGERQYIADSCVKLTYLDPRHRVSHYELTLLKCPCRLYSQPVEEIN
jgi:hypothetical protein